MVQQLRCHTSNAGRAGSNPGQITKIPHAPRPKKRKKKKKSWELLYSTGNYIQHLAITYKEKNLKKNTHTYIYI